MTFIFLVSLATLAITAFATDKPPQRVPGATPEPVKEVLVGLGADRATRPLPEASNNPTTSTGKWDIHSGTALQLAIQAVKEQRPSQSRWVLESWGLRMNQGVRCGERGTPQFSWAENYFTFTFSRDSAREHCALDVPMSGTGVAPTPKSLTIRSIPVPK